MRKIILTALCALAVTAMSFAQANGSGYSTQSTNNPGGVWVQASNGITLNINDIITITNTSPANLSANFVTQADLQAPKMVGGAHFDIQSNRVFDVVAKASAANFTATNIDAGIYGNVPGDVTLMPASVLEMAVTAKSAGAGGLGGYFAPLGSYSPVPNSATGYSAYGLGNGGGPSGDFGPLLLLDGLPGGFNSALPNTTRSFDVAYKANPGWAYAGGTYKLNVIYTAAQE